MSVLFKPSLYCLTYLPKLNEEAPVPSETIMMIFFLVGLFSEQSLLAQAWSWVYGMVTAVDGWMFNKNMATHSKVTKEKVLTAAIFYKLVSRVKGENWLPIEGSSDD
ncbi:unnamed protein product [Ambrosiozyma monospora]|uniref:Unnamed protein product n=1 Tax=Ambrosiozyma monospora TaxID=43982 RepID=A0ACB5T7U6_AMBMO|nr:unnamed protein product [Ambrosiozyma monospora]